VAAKDRIQQTVDLAREQVKVKVMVLVLPSINNVVVKPLQDQPVVNLVLLARR
jgi:hypothetical protein